MAWRIDEQVIRGEIDSRNRERTTGRLWLVGRDEPLELELEGTPWADLAGHQLRFHHQHPQPGDIGGLATRQRGVVGDITASRKIKVPECPIEDVLAATKGGRDFPWHWSNSLYLEWFSQSNGRVVIESTDFQLEIDPEPAWTMSPEDELAQRARNAEAMSNFMNRLSAAHAGQGGTADFDDDLPQSAAEAEADAQADWMNRLLDRIQARVEREGLDEENYEQIYSEERERLRRETGYPPEPEEDPATEQERQERVDEMNAAAAEAMAELEAEKWKGQVKPKRPELVDHSMEFGVKLFHEVATWIPEEVPREHPLIEIVNSVQLASVKIGGALGHDDDEPWPPEPLCAGDTLVRLKKSRDALRDALLGLDSADEENLATPEWRIETRRAVAGILGEVQQLIAEVRLVLRDAD